MTSVLRFGSVLLIAISALSSVRADEANSEKPATERRTHTVERGPFKVEVEVDGVFEAEETSEVRLQLEAWSTLTVEEVVDEGTLVDEGQPILRLETRKLEDELRDLQLQQELGYLSIQQAEAELLALEESAPLDLESAQRAQTTAAEDLDYFLKVGEQQKIRQTEESLKGVEYSLEYAQEELNQLEQMYKADDLTEETEEIILKRARRAVERSQFSLESARLRHDRTLQVLLPREKQQVQESAIRTRLNLAKTESALPTTLQMKRIQLQKLQHTQQQLEEKLALLEADRELMVIESPVAGVVHYGEATRGKWPTTAAIRKKLRPGGSVSANTVLMTIVSDGPSFVRVDVPEDKYRYFQEGTPAKIKPTAFPDAAYPGECEALGPVTVKDGTFDGRVVYDAAEHQPLPVLGMTCKVVLTPYADEDAMTVPSGAVFAEETDSAQHYVYLDGTDEPRMQSVEIGKKHEGRTEILSGLNEGDVILLDQP